MLLRGYLCRVALEAGLMLACALPFVLTAAWQSRTRRWRLLLFVASLVVLNVGLTEIPRVDGFQHLHWSWQECLLSTAWPFLLVALVPGISLASIGVTSRLRPGWLKPSIVGLLLALAVPAVFFILGARKETGRGGLDLPPDHARPRRGAGIPGRISVLVEPGFRETVATG